MIFKNPQDGLSKSAIRHLFTDQIQIKNQNPKITEKSLGILLEKARVGAERIRRNY